MRRIAALLAIALLAASCGRSDGRTAAATCSGRGVKTLLEDQLLIGTDASFPPFASRPSGSSQVAGFDVDLTADLARRIGRKARVVEQTYTGLVAGLLARKYDAIAAGLRVDPSLSAQVCFSDSYLPADQALLTNPHQAPDLDGADAMKGHVVGVIDESPGHSWAEQDLAGAAEIRVYRTDEDAIDNLRAGMVAGIVLDLPRALWYQRSERGIRIVERIALDDSPGYAVAVHPENAGLIEAINLALAEMHGDGTYARVYAKWFGTEPGGETS